MDIDTSIKKVYKPIDQILGPGWNVMSRWLVFAAVLLLVCSLIGDVFIIHHHLTGFSPEADHTPPEYFSFGDTAAFMTIFALIGMLLFSVKWMRVKLNSLTRHFCGWHSSAYLEEKALKIQV